MKTLLPFASAASVALLAISAGAATYHELILADNPVAYYRLEELSGATVADDSSPNGFHGAYSFTPGGEGLPEYPLLGLPGIDTNSVFFRTFTGGLRAGNIRIPFNAAVNPVAEDGIHGAPFSAECWVQPTIQPSDYKVVVSSFGPYGTGTYANASGWNFYQSPGPASFWVLNMKPVVFGQATAVPIVLGQWYHLVATFDGASARFYVNGALQGTYNASGYLANPIADMHISSGPNVGFGPFDGGIDEVAVYTNVLSATQIIGHYQLGTNSFRPAPMPPSITQQPVSITNFSGTTATFEVNALGTLPLHFQWFRETAPIPNATNRDFSFTSLYPADDGAIFYVVVTNSVGSVTSAIVTLTVSTELNILHQPFSITRHVGSKAAFRVVASGAQPIAYQWYKDSEADPIAGATNDTLWLSNLQLADDNTTYFATVRNPFNRLDSAPATLLVVPRPSQVPLTGYARVVVADDPVAYWRLDDSAAATDAVGSFDGTYNSGAGTFTFGAAPGIPRETNGAVGLTGGAVVTIPYALELNPVTGPWSAEAWVSPATLDPGHFRTVFSSMYNPDFGNHVFGWNVYQHVAGVWTLNIFNGGSSSTFVSDFVHNPLVPGSWYHMVITHDLTRTRFYVNGALVGSALQTAPRFTPNGVNGNPSQGGGPTVLGQRSDNAFDPFDGTIDDVAFYNYALSPGQIQTHYANSVALSLTRSGNTIVFTWPFGTLQHANEISGPFETATGVISGQPISPTGLHKFYRVLLE